MGADGGAGACKWIQIQHELHLHAKSFYCSSAVVISLLHSCPTERIPHTHTHTRAHMNECPAAYAYNFVMYVWDDRLFNSYLFFGQTAPHLPQ